jgi:hypothetical protein
MDPVQAFLQSSGLTSPAFAPTSRYYGIETAQFSQPDGRVNVYVRRRFLPQPERLSVLRTVNVAAGDRLDTLAAQLLGDPEQSWRLCDANRAMQPEALVATVGETLVVTLAEGVPGVSDAG